MIKLLRLLTAVNAYFSRYFYAAAVFFVISINIYDLLFKSYTDFQRFGNLCTVISIIVLSIVYLRSQKSDLFCMFGILSLGYMSVFLFCVKRITINDVLGFVLCSIFVVMVIVALLVRLNKDNLR